MRWNKKGISITFEMTIFIILNIVFILLLLIFVRSAGSGAFVYEKIYAKQIALIIDNSEPDMTVSLDMEKAMGIAEKNGKRLEDMVKINSENNEVTVSLSPRGGHVFQYFSDYKVSPQFHDEINKLVLVIREKDE